MSNSSIKRRKTLAANRILQGRATRMADVIAAFALGEAQSTVFVKPDRC